MICLIEKILDGTYYFTVCVFNASHPFLNYIHQLINIESPVVTKLRNKLSYVKIIMH